MATKKTKPVPSVGPFTGFPKPGLSWFQSLAVAQNREWFQAHKDGYEQLWLAPMTSLLAELRAPLEKIYGRKLGPPGFSGSTATCASRRTRARTRRTWRA